MFAMNMKNTHNLRYNNSETYPPCSAGLFFLCSRGRAVRMNLDNKDETSGMLKRSRQTEVNQIELNLCVIRKIDKSQHVRYICISYATFKLIVTTNKRTPMQIMRIL